MKGAASAAQSFFIPGSALTKIFAISEPGRLLLTRTKLRVPNERSASISFRRYRIRESFVNTTQPFFANRAKPDVILCSRRKAIVVNSYLLACGAERVRHNATPEIGVSKEDESVRRRGRARSGPLLRLARVGSHNRRPARPSNRPPYTAQRECSSSRLCRQWWVDRTKSRDRSQ